MNLITAPRRIALVAVGVLAIAIAGCSSSASPSPSASEAAASSSPAPSVVPSVEATPSAVATVVPPSDAVPSLGLPSFSADRDLESVLPDQLGGEQVLKFSFAGAQFLQGGTSDTKDFEELLKVLGKSPSDFSVAIGGTASGAGVVAFRIKGVDANAVIPAFIQAATKDTPGTNVTDASIGGKSVKKLSAPSESDAYLYANGDIIFFVGGEEMSAALIAEVFSKLP